MLLGTATAWVALCGVGFAPTLADGGGGVALDWALGLMAAGLVVLVTAVVMAADALG